MTTDQRSPYKVYHLNKHTRTFQSRDEAAKWVSSQKSPGDYEILDKSDEE